MANVRKLTLIAGTLVVVLAATGLAAQDQNSTPTPQTPMMGQGQGMMPIMGMMQQMSQMMETCNKMMQAHMEEPHHSPEQRPQSNQ